MRYVIANKNTVLVPEDVNTTPSRYPVLSFTTLRKARNRQEARSVKGSFKNPRQYAIIDTQLGLVVR